MSSAQFCDVAFFYAEPEEIARDIRLFISEFPDQNAYMLIHRGKNSGTYKKIKDSAEQNGIMFRQIDSRLMRENPMHTFELCLVSLSEGKDTGH